MAQRTPRSGRVPARAAAKSRKTVTTTEVEVAEDTAGLGFDTGVAIMTSIVLIAALILVDALMGQYGKGIFFG